ncbi:MAG: hypothetical protein M5U12_38050 [Verrucomicrobia bacterium]|nr:hypothetical protein [Verrucomicrobiota bacterium]
MFVGLPWKNVKRKWENAIDRLKIRSPLVFVIVGRDDIQDARDLLDLIKLRMDSSSYAIFDATAGNANVSLEYGYAEARDIKRALYISAHKASQKAKDQPIISDLAGKTRQQYKNEPALKRLLGAFSASHPYTKRFESFLDQRFRGNPKGEKKRLRSLALKVIHSCDGNKSVRREDVIQQLLGDVSHYSRTEVDSMIKELHKAGLIYSKRGRYSTM